ncbi:MAG: ABC transporter permease [Chitinophagales bacterium]
MFKAALRFIVYDKPKSLGALFGVIISVFLIGQQVGIFIFLTNMMSNLVDHIDADIWVIDNRSTNANALGQIAAKYQLETWSIPGVEQTYPLVLSASAAKFMDGSSGGVTLVGSQAPAFVGGPWNISGGPVTNLLFDNAVTTEFYDSKLLGNAQLGTHFEIGGKRAWVALQTRGARGFGASYVFTTIERARYLGNFPKDKISAVLIKLKPGANPEETVRLINKNIYGVKAWTKKDLSAATVKTVLGSSGIATSVGTLILFAIISGSIVIGLTLYSAATDRLKDYATLKAIGATNAYVRNLILTQAIIFAAIGFVIAIGLMEGFRLGIANAGVMFSYTWLMYAAFAFITILISASGAVAAINRITKVEPASVFRG